MMPVTALREAPQPGDAPPGASGNSPAVCGIQSCGSLSMINPPIHLRLPQELLDAVLAAAQADERTTADMIRKLLKEALARRFASQAKAS